MHTGKEVETFCLPGAVAAVPTANKRMMESVRWNGPFETCTSLSFPFPLTAINQLRHRHFAGERNRRRDGKRFDVHDLRALHSPRSKRVVLRREPRDRQAHTLKRTGGFEFVGGCKGGRTDDDDDSR